MTHKTLKKPIKPREQPFWRLSTKAFLRTLAVGAGLLLIGTLALCFLDDPAPAIQPTALLLSATTALTGGWIAGRLHRTAPALCGLCNGALLLACMLLLSLPFHTYAAGYSLGVALLLHALVPVLSVIGAVLGVQSHRKHTAKKRR